MNSFLHFCSSLCFSVGQSSLDVYLFWQGLIHEPQSLQRSTYCIMELSTGALRSTCSGVGLLMDHNLFCSMDSSTDTFIWRCGSGEALSIGHISLRGPFRHCSVVLSTATEASRYPGMASSRGTAKYTCCSVDISMAADTSACTYSTVNLSVSYHVGAYMLPCGLVRGSQTLDLRSVCSCHPVQQHRSSRNASASCQARLLATAVIRMFPGTERQDDKEWSKQ